MAWNIAMSRQLDLVFNMDVWYNRNYMNPYGKRYTLDRSNLDSAFGASGWPMLRIKARAA